MQDCDVYIGRRLTQGGWNLRQSIWANPYKPIDIHDGIRGVDGAVIAYYRWLLNKPELLENIPILKGKILGCWCKDTPADLCHGDILDWFANGEISPALKKLMQNHPDIDWRRGSVGDETKNG